MSRHIHLPLPLPMPPVKAEAVRRRRLRGNATATGEVTEGDELAFPLSEGTAPGAAPTTAGRSLQRPWQGGSSERALSDDALRTVLQGQEQG